MDTPAGINAALGTMEQGRVGTDDGVELLYQAFGAGPTVVFANGIGVRYPGAVKQVQALRGRYRVLCWDYRGIGQSVMPPEADVSMARHAGDVVAILDHLEIDDAILVGWSMGVQVSLEVVRAHPDRVRGIVALLGGCGRPFDDAFPSPVARATRGLFGWLHRHPDLMQGAFDLAVAIPDVAFSAMSKMTFVGRSADRDVFAANVRSVAGVDKRIYTRTMLALAEHNAWDLLPEVACPALVVAGSRDWLTPPRVARRMVAAMPAATYHEVPGGTHFALIEQSESINRWLVDFVDRVHG